MVKTERSTIEIWNRIVEALNSEAMEQNVTSLDTLRKNEVLTDENAANLLEDILIKIIKDILHREPTVTVSTADYNPLTDYTFKPFDNPHFIRKEADKL